MGSDKDRLGEALRRNLKRRKEQQRERAAAEAAPPAPDVGTARPEGEDPAEVRRAAGEGEG